jgi:hypothetical protein
MRRDLRSFARPRVSSAGVGTRRTQAPFAPNGVVANEYAAVSAKIDAVYSQQPEVAADNETAVMARLRRKAQARMLGDGLCTRPVVIDCRVESACETCAYFRTSVQFLPTLTRQRDHAQQHGQADRAALFESLIQRVDPDSERR